QQGNSQKEALSLGNIGLAYESLSDYSQAVDYFEQTLTIAQKLKDRQLIAGIQGNLGNNYLRIGNYPQAISAFDESLTLWQELNSQAAVGQVLRGMGNVQIAIGNYDKAQTLHQQALTIAQDFNNTEGIIYSHNSLGAIAANQGKYPQAIQAYQQSLKVIESLDNPNLSQNLTAQTLNNLASANHAQMNFDRALDYYQQSLEIAQTNNLVALEGTIISGMGSVYLSLDDYPKAKENLELGLLKAQTSGDRLLEAESLHNLGYAQWKLNQLSEAESSFRQAIAIRESMREGLDDLDVISLFDTQLQSYPLLRRVLIAQNKPEAALEVAEAERARAFIELLATRLTPEEASNEALRQQTTPPNIEQIKNIARQHNATLVEYAFIADENFIAQGKLHGEYQQIYIWVVQPTGEVNFQAVSLSPQQAKAIVNAGNWSKDWQNRTSTIEEDELFTSFIDLHRGLYPILIEPIAQHLPTSPDDLVIFLPQSELFQISFPALQDANQNYLIEKHSILTAPSIQVLEFTYQQRQRLRNDNSEQALVVGNPVMPTEIITATKNILLDLVALPGAETEAEAIAQILQTTQIIGQVATESSIKQQMPNARLIHLATHGLLDDFSNSGIPGAIALTPGEGEDGVLTSNEILNLNLNAELVVVSACDLGRGLVTRDGVVGLSRSLMAAGTPSIILALWEIYDQSTSVLMQEFYLQLEQGNNKAQSLRQAMLKTKQEFPHPINWGAFTLIGEAN
ncbi:MAG: CHAT domain-containing tetratricopeptide repeat protein, partial [Cyanobacteria bacterium P01_G01_bin.19]